MLHLELECSVDPVEYARRFLEGLPRVVVLVVGGACCLDLVVACGCGLWRGAGSGSTVTLTGSSILLFRRFSGNRDF